jgi:hypothetical protein
MMDIVRRFNLNWPRYFEDDEGEMDLIIEKRFVDDLRFKYETEF